MASTSPQTGVAHFIAPAEEVDARTDAIAEANRRVGLLTLVGKKTLDSGQVEATCIAFRVGQAEQARQIAQDLGLGHQDQTTIKAPSAGEAAAQLDF